MGATKVTQLTKTETLGNNDLFYTVKDVDTTPVSRGISKDNVKKVLGIAATQQTRIVSGGMEWVSGLTYQSVNLVYEIAGQQFIITDGTQVTLSAAPTTPTYERIDLIYGDDTGSLGIAVGTESATPATPSLELYQIQLTLILLTTNATTPSGVSLRNVYTENAGQTAEFDATESTSGARIDLADTSAPITGTYSIKTTTVLNDADVITFTHATATTFVNFLNLKLDFKLLTDWGNDYLQMGLYSGSTLVAYLSVNSSFLDVTNITDVQSITLFKNDFNIDVGVTEFDTIKLYARVKGTSTLSFILDNIYINEDANASSPTGVTGADVSLDTSNFVGNLDSTTTDVQKFADAFDAYVAAGGGDVSGPASAIDENITVFNGTGGKIIKDSGVNISAVNANTAKISATTANVDAAGATMNTDFDANTILAATTDNTPVALTVSEQTFVGRITGGNIDSLTVSESKTMLKDRLLENSTVSGSYALDYAAYELWNLTLTGATTFTESNLEEKTILIRCTGNFALTFPANWSTDITGAYDGTVQNIIVVQYFKAGVYKVQITQPD